MKNYMKKTGIHILAVAALCASTTSCSESFDTSFFDKEIEDLSLAAGLKIGYSEYTASELFEEIGDDIEVGTTDDNGKPLVSFTYTETLDSGENSDFVSVDNQGFDGDFDLLADSGLVGSAPYIPGLIPDDKVEDSFSAIEALEGLDSELTMVNFSEGTFTISLDASTEAQTEIVFSIPSLTNKNTNLKYQETFIINNNSGDDILSIPVDLKDYTFDFTIDNLDPETNNGFNNIAIQLDATVTFEGGDQVSSDDTLTYNIVLENPKVEYAEGDFKDAGFDVNTQNFDLDFFETLGEGTIEFLNPILKLTATSGYGFPIGLTLEGISGQSENTTTNLIIEDSSPIDDNIEAISGGTGNYAILNAATTNGSTTESEIILNAANSNLEDILNAKPTSFDLTVTASANPNSPDNNENFFDVDNALGIDIAVELPLYVTFDGLTFTPDPFEFDGEDTEDLEDTNSLDLLLFTRNSIPLTGEISLEFLDANGSALFTKPATLMEAAPLDSDNFSAYTLIDGVLKNGTTIIEPTKTTVTLDSDEIGDLSEVTHIQAVIEFNTTNSSAAKIQSTDKVRLDLSILADFKVSNDDEDDNN